MRKAVMKRAIVLFLLMVFLVPILSFTNGDDIISSAPDLKITQFTIDPTDDGYMGTLKVKNIGKSSARTIEVIVFDEAESVEVNKTIVISFPIPSPDPQFEFEKTFKWEPEIPGIHVLWAVVDVDGDEIELTKRNNVASIMIELPFLNEIHAGSDGIKDERILGTYISGIENWVDLDIRYDGISDPSLIRVYATVNGQFLEYGTYSRSNVFGLSFNAGSLPPGSHEMKVNTSFGGQPLRSENYTIEVVGHPPWFGSLKRSRSFFDNEMSAYTLKGRMDIPGYSFSTDIEGDGGTDEFTIFDDIDEMFLTAYVLHDGTTTFVAECDMSVTNGDVEMDVIQTAKAFSSTMNGPVKMIAEGTTWIEMDLVDVVPGGQFPVSLPFGEDLKVPLPSNGLNGTISSHTGLEIQDDGNLGPLTWDVSWSLEGNSTFIHVPYIPGWDDPRMAISADFKWTGGLVSGAMAQSSNSIIEHSSEVFINDLGLQWGNRPDEWDIVTQGTGLDIAIDPNGAPGTVSLSVKDGHMTRLIYEHGETGSEIYVNNTYKSSPALSYLWDGRPMIIWTEAGYMEDREERAGSMRMRYLIGDINGNFTGDPIPLFSDGHMDHQPTLFSDHYNERVGLMWIRDMDGNSSSIHDREVMYAFFDHRGWSPPIRITEDNSTDSRPDLFLSMSGGMYMLWFSGDDLKFLHWTNGNPSGSPQRMEISEETIVHHAEYGVGETPTIRTVISRPGKGYEMVVNRWVNSEENSTVRSSNSYISTPFFLNTPGMATIASWSEWSKEGQDLFSSYSLEEEHQGPWSAPLRLTKGPEVEISHMMARDGNNDFILGTLTVGSKMDGTPIPAPEIFRNVNLSWGSDLVSIEATPGPGATPGTMVKVTATLEYRGMTPGGRALVDLYRIFKDSSTGNLTQEFWDSEMVEFTIYGQTRQVEFTLPIKEYQIGLTAYSRPALSSIPSHESQIFISLPALADLEIISMERTSDLQNDAISPIQVSIKNWGVVSSGPRTIQLFTSEPTAPMMFENCSFEPVLLRERVVWRSLNSTQVEVPAGTTVQVRMNITLQPGMNHVWAEASGLPWQPSVMSGQDLILPSFPRVEQHLTGPGKVMSRSDPIDVVVTVENTGPWSLNSSIYRAPEIGMEGLRYTPPDHRFELTMYLSGVGTFFKGEANISDLQPGETEQLNWTFPPLGASGVLKVRGELFTGLEILQDDIEPRSIASSTVMISDPDLVFLSLVQTSSDEVYHGSLKLQYMNPTGNRLDVVHIKIYNGLPGDNVVISEAIILDVTPGEFGNHTLSISLPEGRYILSASATVATVSGDGKRTNWYVMDPYVRDIAIEEVGQKPVQEDNELDMNDLTTAAIIATSALMFTLLIASFFFKREQDEQEDKK